MILFIKLLLAHLLGDFVFQPTSWVTDKERKKHRSAKLYLHGLVHFLLIVVFTRQQSLLPAALAIAVAHVGIDMAKLVLQQERNKRAWFFADQFLHILVLLAVTGYLEKPDLDAAGIAEPLLIVATGIVFLLTPASLIIKIVLSKWTPATAFKSDKLETPALLQAGMVIGYLERITVFIFILNDQWAAIGFLVTAKSVFRFSDLKAGQDRKLTEYILIGTLLSFGIAIVTGLLAALAMQH